MKVAFDKQFKAVNSYNLAPKVQAKEIENAELPQMAISPETCRVYFTGKACVISDKEFKVLKEKVQKQLGTDFNLKDFHKSFLTIGPASRFINVRLKTDKRQH